MLDAGADKVSVNSSALARPELIGELADVFGAQCVVVAIDAKRRDDGGLGRLRQRGRTVVEGREAVDWAREAVERGAGEMLLTSMDRDGTTDGYDLELTRAVADAVAVPVIASGGAGELEHLVEAIGEGGADAVLCASIFHYGTFTGARRQAAPRRRGDPGRGSSRLVAAATSSRRPLPSRFSPLAARLPLPASCRRPRACRRSCRSPFGWRSPPLPLGLAVGARLGLSF